MGGYWSGTEISEIIIEWKKYENYRPPSTPRQKETGENRRELMNILRWQKQTDLMNNKNNRSIGQRNKTADDDNAKSGWQSIVDAFKPVWRAE